MEGAYAQAIARELAAGKKEDEVVKNLVAHLKRSGRLKLLPDIHRALKTLAARTKASQPKVEVADQREAKKALQEAKEYGIVADTADVNPTLIHGWRGTQKGVLVDRSGKRALSDMYQRVIRA